MAREETRPLTFGVFTPPIVRPDSSPAWAFARMLQLTEHLDALGFDEAWFGEHHNGGWELMTETLRYLDFTTPMARGLTDIHDVDRTVSELNATGLMVIGTPDMLVEHLRGFQHQTGGFGGFLGFGTEMADLEATRHSHELLMDRVAPHFDGSSARQQENFAHVARLGDDWKDQVRRAQSAVTTDNVTLT